MPQLSFSPHPLSHKAHKQSRLFFHPSLRSPVQSFRALLREGESFSFCAVQAFCQQGVAGRPFSSYLSPQQKTILYLMG